MKIRLSKTQATALKTFLLLLVLYIGFADLIGDEFNDAYYQPPEKWLTDNFGSEAITDSFNLYEADAWNTHYYAATSIKDDYVYVIDPSKNIFQVYNFNPLKISARECAPLAAAINALKSHIKGEKIDPSFQYKYGGLDGPVVTLVKHEADHHISKTWDSDEDTVGVAYNVFIIAMQCNKQRPKN